MSDHKSRSNEKTELEDANVGTKNSKDKSDENWTSSPVFFVSSAVVATAFACLTYFNEFALPQRTARLEDQAYFAEEKFKKMQVKLKSEIQRASDLEKKLNALKAKEASLRRLLSEARTADLFIRNSAYPNGFATIRVGMSISDVYAAYPKGSIRKSDTGYLSINLESSPFSSVTYYYDRKTENEAITHIFFTLKYSPEEVKQNIVKRLTENMGNPLKVSNRHFMWTTQEGVNALVSDDRGYMIMDDRYRPALWPQDEEVDALCLSMIENKCPVPPSENKT